MALHKATTFIFLLVAVGLTQQGPIITAVEPNAETPSRTDYRLDNSVTPENYKLKLTLPEKFYETATFSGVVDITLRPTETTKQNIIINAKDIKLPADKSVITLCLSTEDEKTCTNRLDTTAIKEDAKFERIVFKLKDGEQLSKENTYRLHIKYDGKLHNDMYGFYLSSYENENGDKEFLATTQFQPTHARRAFPCFDEPHLKATFDITITYPPGYYAISNGDFKEITDGPNEQTTTFQTSPKMSTYLVAFIVSKFSTLYQFSNKVAHNRVWSRIELLDSARYALDISPKIIGKLNEITNLLYTKDAMKKLDQIAIPDFSAGAMENWGLVTYRESALLWDEKESPKKTKQRVAAVIAHELTHMWFGNLVTCHWWSSTWLNEGFARYFQYFVTHEVETKWELDKQFVVEQQRSILIGDALQNSAPLTHVEDDILTPDQISGKFGSISYNKGASVIRMMRNFLGEETFKKGIQKYLSTNQGKNTKPDDLWGSFENIPNGILPEGKKLKDVMDTWINQAGYPVVTIKPVKNTKNYELTQERFISHEKESEEGEQRAEEAGEPAWYVPVTYKTSKDTEKDSKKKWLNPGGTLTLTDVPEDMAWILLNVADSGYYRVNYDNTLWEKLTTTLSGKDFIKIDVLNRAQLVDDAMNLARANKVSYKTALDLASYLEQETEYYPWYLAFNSFSYLRQRLNPTTEVAQLLNRFIRILLTNLYKSSSFEIGDDKSQIDVYKNALALTWACELGEKECIGKSEELYESFRIDDKKIDPDLRSVVYCYALRDSKSKADWDFLRERLSKTQLPSEITTIITALGCTRDEAKLKEYLQDSINLEKSGIRKQDAQTVYTAVMTGNPEGVPVAFEFLKNNFENIRDSYGGMNALSSVITTTADRLTSKDQVNEFERFINDNQEKLKDAYTVGKQAIEKAKENLEWATRYEPDLLAYLKANVPTTTPKPPETTSAEPPPSTTPGGAATATICSTIFMLSILKAVFRI